MKSGRYIAIEGPIGVGKTTLATRLSADLGAGLLCEDPDENPFLEDFYENPRGNALSTQLYFLVQRTRQIDSLRQSDLFDNGCVADFTFDKDSLFARLNLSGREWTLYDEIHSRLAWQAPRPDCVIYLDASLETLMRRIAARGRPAEANLERAYLMQVVAAYREFFRDYRATRIIRVDAQAMDLVHESSDYQSLLAALDHPAMNQQLPVQTGR